ncbi:NAD(P)-binding protein [Aspergillus keveii]|uniref:NAD(P)-binding protein n=1 Tax=Aspergillus keveii TaxID=714993 RepID=A0ABR4FQ49_9EURO
MSSVPSRMQACQLLEYNQPYELHDVPTPTISDPYAILVRVAAASFCHTDLMVQSGLFRSKTPLIPLHEGAGTVVSAGPAVTRCRVGDRVLCHVINNLCGNCSACTGPEEANLYCDRVGSAPGISRDGAFAEYMLVDSRTAARIPDSVDFATAAPLACAGGTVWKALLHAGLKPGQWLGVVGAGGGLGHITVLFAKKMGLKVVGVDARDEGLGLSRECGADVVLDARSGKRAVAKEALAATGGGGVDAVINASGHDDAAALACAITRKHGLLVQVAHARLSRAIPFDAILSLTTECFTQMQPPTVLIPFREIIFRDIRVKGTLICSPNELQDTVDFVGKHNNKVKLTRFSGLSAVSELFDAAQKGDIIGKAVVDVKDEAACRL